MIGFILFKSLDFSIILTSCLPHMLFRYDGSSRKEHDNDEKQEKNEKLSMVCDLSN